MARRSLSVAEERIKTALRSGATELDLQGLGLADVPESLRALHRSLTRLFLGNNNLTSLPSWLAEFRSLTSLFVDRNRLTTVSLCLRELTGLENLSLARNDLALLPQELEQFGVLASLDLSENPRLASWRVMPELPRLKAMALRKIGLAELPEGFERYEGLVRLDISGNLLTELPSALRGLFRLSHLDIRGNQISVLPDWLVDFADMTALQCQGNPLVDPPREVLAGGTDVILRFLRERRDGGSRGQWSAKLLVVGDGDAGKTSLVKQLAGETFNIREPRTPGLGIRTLTFDHPSETSQPMALSVWDFGGQEVYNAPHQFFLTDESLVMLVFNGRDESKTEAIEPWLEMIVERAPHAPILIVATRGNENTPDIRLKALQSRFATIAGFVIVDNEDQLGIAKLRGRIAVEAAALPSMGQEWPASWLEAADALRKVNEPRITVERLWEVMEEAGLHDEQSRRDLARTLHFRGNLLYFEGNRRLDHMAILDPSWLNEAIYKLLSHGPVRRNEGIATWTHVDEVWSDHPREERLAFVNLMDMFDIAYPVVDDDAACVVVELLPKDAPDAADVWPVSITEPDTTEIAVRYYFDGHVLPAGIPTWFIARERRFATGVQWSEGTLLARDDGHQALLRVISGNGVELAVRGRAPIEFFHLLDNGFRETLKRHPGREFTRKVPCPCGGGRARCRFEFDRDRIQQAFLHARDGEVTQFTCPESGMTFSTARLLFALERGDERVPSLLASFQQTIMSRLDATSAKIDDLAADNALTLERMLREFRIVARKSEVRCPSVFTVQPIGKQWAWGGKVKLRFYCEAPSEWHPLEGDQACYEVREYPDWLKRSAPHLRRILKLLSLMSPAGRATLGEAAKLFEHDEHVHHKDASRIAADERYSKELEDARNFLSKIPKDLAIQGLDDPLAGMDGADLSPTAFADVEADYRELSLWWAAHDGKWGGLSRHDTPEGDVVFVCRDHKLAYEASPRLSR